MIEQPGGGDAPPPPDERAGRPAPLAGFLGLLVGVVATPVMVTLAALSAGAGHGGYGAARMLFPGPMLATQFTGDTIDTLSIWLALAQFPLYGLIIGLWPPRSRVFAFAAVGAVHAFAALMASGGALPNFS